MAVNYFKTIRKSSAVHVIISVLTNLVVFGQPVQQMMIDYYGNKEVISISSSNSASFSYRGEETDNNKDFSKSNKEENNKVNKEKITSPATVFYAREPQGVIGKLFEVEAENSRDNYFTVNLPEDIDFNNYNAVLSYDLYGVAEASQTTKSINDNLSYGGKTAVLSDKWQSVEEPVAFGHLVKGENTIFFNRRVSDNYQYKIRNLKIELKEKQSDVAISVSSVTNYNGHIYLTGVVLNNEVEKVIVNGTDVALCDNVFEYASDNNSKSVKELTVTYSDKNNKKHTVKYEVSDYQKSDVSFDFNKSVLINNSRIYNDNELATGVLNYDTSFSVSVIDNSVLTDKMAKVTVSGLEFKDLKTLEDDLKNVTAGSFSGYRLQKYNMPDSTGLKLHLKYDPEKIPSGYTAKDVKTFYFDKTQRNWKVLEVDSLDYVKKEIISTVYNNETDFINGVIKVPESPETGSFTPTTISDMKYADPASGVVSIAPPSANSTGAASTSFPIKLPGGRNGLQPSLAVTYNSEAGNGWMGMGWNLATEGVSINTKWGVPTFSSYESELYSLSGGDLVLQTASGDYTNPHRQANIPRQSERQFYMRKEGGYQKIIRHGTSPSNYWWEVTDKQGNKSYYGGVTGVDNSAVIRTPSGNIAYWALKRVKDPFGNYIDYTYAQNTAYTLPGAGITGNEFYISRISYTRRSGISNYYTVDFKRNNYTVAASGQSTSTLNRSDVMINNRNGYTQIIDDLLTEIQVSFVQGSSSQRIRTYRFDYEEQAFGKQHLIKVSEFDTANKLFYTNTMEYYDQVGSGDIISSTSTTWSNGSDDEITSLLYDIASDTGIIPNGSALGTSTSSGSSFALRAGVGIGYNPWQVNTTIGFSGNYSKSDQDTKISFIDINGDGLPDKVYKNDNGVFYRPNTGNGFGSTIDVEGVSLLSTTKSSTFGQGVDANALGLLGVGKSWSKTKTETNNYFTDFNGDGLPDIAKNGRVYFNTTSLGQNSTHRAFGTSVTNSENVIEPGAVDASIIDGLRLETLDEIRGEHPQYDHVKAWKAPFSGKVDIVSIAKLRTKNVDADNNTNQFRLTIERYDVSQGTNTVVSTTAMATVNQSVTINPQNILVDKGDIIFFRVHNLDYGYGGEMEWNPIITYDSTTVLPYTHHIDENGKYVDVYNSTQDFMLNNGGAISGGNGDSSVTLKFNLDNSTFAPYEFSDDIRFIIKKVRIDLTTGDQTTSPSWVWERVYDHETGFFSGTANQFTHGIATSSSLKDVFYFSVESTSNVNWGGINWHPQITGTNLGTKYPSVSYMTYDNNINQTKYWITSSDLMNPVINSSAENDDPLLIVHHDLGVSGYYSSFLNNFGADDFPLQINWVVKEQDANNIKAAVNKTLYIYRTTESSSGVWNYHFTKTKNINDVITPTTQPSYFSYTLTKERVKQIKNGNGKIFSAFYIKDSRFGTNNVGSVFIDLATAEQGNYSFPQVIFGTPFMAQSPDFYGYSYRGWGQFLYNGGLGFTYDDQGNISNLGSPVQYGANPIDINVFGDESDAQQYDNTDYNVAPTTTGDTSVRYTLYNQGSPDNKFVNGSIKDAIYGINSAGLLTATVGRFGEQSLYDVYIDPDDIVTSGTNIFIGMKQRAESKGSAESGTFVVYSGTQSEAYSEVLNMHLDLNGDRYPDIVSDKIQYTNMLGALSSNVKASGFYAGDESEDDTEGISTPGNYPNSTESSNGNSAWNKTLTNINAGVNESTGKSFNSKQWTDINGDGLPDKVTLSGTTVSVHLNTGYDFTDAVEWSTGQSSVDLTTSNRSNTSAGGGYSFSSSFAAGFGAAESNADINVMLLDVNGDGLPDLVYEDPNTGKYDYLLNTGKDFTGPAGTFYNGATIDNNYSLSGNVYGSYTYGHTIPTPLPGLAVKITASPSVGLNAGFNEKRTTLQDLDGDGFVDVINKSGTTNNSNISTRLNKVGKTHLLKKVNTPLGGSWIIDYERNGNTYNLPQNKWVLSSVVTYDGFIDDNPYKTDYSMASVNYSNPKYDRREREFLGFGEVTVQQLDPSNQSVYRSVVTTYHNENYYLSGAVKSTAMYTASGQPLSLKTTLYNLLDPETPQVNMDAGFENSYLQVGLSESLLDQSRLFIAVAKVTSINYENGDSLTSETEFLDYDENGNLTSYIDYGEGGDDTYRSDITYYSSVGSLQNSTGFPKTISVYQNSSNTLMRYRSAEYSSLGKLSKVTTKLNGTENNRVSFSYDAYGNLTTVNDLDNLDASSSYYAQGITYDTTLRTYPIAFNNSFGESSSMQYEYLFGTPVLSTDMNGEQMRTRIDTRGRVIEVTGPNEMAIENQGGSGSKWTIRMEYKGEEAITGNINSNIYMLAATGVFQAVEPGGSNPTHAQHYAVTRHFDPLISNNQFLTISIVDGFGQPVQVKKTHKSDLTMKWMLSGFEKKDAFGRTLNAYLPATQTDYPTNLYSLSSTHLSYKYVAASSMLAPTVMTYDEKDRVKTVKQPGESQTTQITYSVDEGMLVQNVTNELSQTMATYTDIRGRKRKTIQNNEITTLFEYNAINELTSITDNDSFVTNYLYDTAGRVTEMQHPDRGVITYKYNKKGNIIEQSNSNMLLNGNQKVNYYYDFHRLIRVEYPQMPQNQVKYTYGEPGNALAESNNAVGRLLYQEDASGVQMFGYGHMGEVTKNLRSVAVAGYQSFWFITRWEYDSWNRVQEIIYPDFERVHYHYNKAGMIEKIDSEIDGISGLQDIVSNVNYNDYGERTSMTYGNGTVTYYDYDVRRRMNALSHSFTNMSLTKKYEFDALSNILSIKTEDPANTLPATGQIGGAVTHNYAYDDYNQLVGASGSYTGSNDVSTPYLQQDYQLTMKYNLDHTIDNKVQLHNQGLVSSYGGNVSNQVVVEKNSYDLKYSDYGTGAFVAGPNSYGYQQPHAPRKITEYPSWVGVSEN
ncbi:toxin TcdB middle/N-terminal domain-containing protein, partial [Flavobacterium sp. ST-75]